MNKDHYWDDSTNNDGHHKWVQMPQQGTPAVPTDATLATGMDAALFIKATNVLNTYQDVQPFFINNSDINTPGVTNLMQMLGMRACGVFSGRSSNGNCTLIYQFNLKPDPGGAVLTWGARRTAQGNYTVYFNNTLPSANYLVFGGYSGSTLGNLVVTSEVSPGVAKTTTFCSLEARTIPSQSAIDPSQLWFFCFGG